MLLTLFNCIKICSLSYTHINITDSTPPAYPSDFLNFPQLFCDFFPSIVSFKILFSSIYFEVMQAGCLSAPTLSEVPRPPHTTWDVPSAPAANTNEGILQPGASWTVFDLHTHMAKELLSARSPTDSCGAGSGQRYEPTPCSSAL